MTLDLEEYKARLAEYNKNQGEGQFIRMFDPWDVAALIAEVERLRAEMKQVKLDFHWATD
jgi:hypothetical protein